MAPGAAVEIHRRSKAIDDIFHFYEIVLAGVEKRQLSRGQSRQGSASTRGSSARSRIPGCRRIWWPLRLNGEQGTPNQR
jgi:hypothetical protein